MAENGVYNVRFFVRGKPWVVSIDDYFPMLLNSDDEPELLVGAMGGGNSMWGPLLVKAWAKIKGNYLNGRFDITANGMRALTGAPVFDYYSAEFGESEEGMDEMWDTLLDAESKNYLMTASSNGLGGEWYVNGCGIRMAHSYSIISAFVMTDAQGYENRCLLMRNPEGKNGYNWRWGPDDPKWTDGMAAQVPFNFDPRVSNQDETGMFVAPLEAFLDNPGVGYCFVNIQIGHSRVDEGYTDKWYDIIDADEGTTYKFYTTADTIQKPFYVSAETYGFAIVPEECTSAWDAELDEYSMTPIVTVGVSWGDANPVSSYWDYQTRPIVIS